MSSSRRPAASRGPVAAIMEQQQQQPPPPLKSASRSSGSSRGSREIGASSRSLEKRVRAQKKRRMIESIVFADQLSEEEKCAFHECSQGFGAKRKHLSPPNKRNDSNLIKILVTVLVLVIFIAQDFLVSPQNSTANHPQWTVHCATNQNSTKPAAAAVHSSSSSSSSKKPTSQIARSSSSSSNPKSAVKFTHKVNKNLAASKEKNSLRRTTTQDVVDPEQELQISITPRVSQIKVPVDSNAMLKCLISSSSAATSGGSSGSGSGSGSGTKLSQKFDIHWSRFMYDEHVYEQLDTSPLTRDNGEPTAIDNVQSNNKSTAGGGVARLEARSSLASQSEDVLTGRVAFNRREQLRDFLSRSRQETNVISDLLIEATLSISPVKASDNASYYCTAIDGRSSSLDQNQARIDLIALSRPVVQLERVIPARDSKSAQIHWLVLSDGNTPIKKTILMVRNDTRAAFSSRPLPPELAATTSTGADYEPVTTTTSQYSSMVIDSDFNQWQRIEIQDEMLDALDDSSMDQSSSSSSSSSSPPLRSPYDNPPLSASAAADVDVTSPLGAPSGANSNRPDQDYYMSRLKWNLLRANKRRRQSYNLTSLLPGITYNFRLAAINDMGQSEWSHLTATMPNEIPAQIGEMFLLSRSNDSLMIGWRRPAYDGAKTIRYEMQLFDLNRTLTLDANTNTSSIVSGSPKTNFMYIFVNLNPGTDYHFHVRACSRAGCSAYSSPKLLASTMDGEPDEPLEVELSCEFDSGNVSVSWLPPASPRGQLLNYTVSFDSRARHRNQSGQWQVDEWRSSMETADNQTLSLEAGGVLLPNTNYSVRVCANNRSKHCGKFSQLTSRAQCSTPSELPGELPPGIKLKKQQQTGQEQQAESLQLQLPFISSRNGSLSCIQIVLIRLPDSFPGSGGNLRAFLPNHADGVTLSRYSSNGSQQNKPTNALSEQQTEQRPLAYLAEEVDPSSAAPFETLDNNQQVPFRRISLGDGSHEQCRVRELEPIARPEVFDGPLMARAFYTGFVKLILVRPNYSRTRYSNYPMTEMKRSAHSGALPTLDTASVQQEILTKYSDYFEPVQMGDNVLEVSENRMTSYDIELGAPFSSTDGGVKLRNLQELATELGVSLRRNLNKYYNITSSYVGENLRLEVLGDFIRKSSPLMQLLEVGVIVIVISLFLLFFVYLLTLPTSIARRRRRRMKRQLNKHQQQVAASQQLLNTNQPFEQMDKSEPTFGQIPAPMAEQPHDMIDERPSIEYRPVDQLSPRAVMQQQQKLYGLGLSRECPIHSSPANSNASNSRLPPPSQQQQHHEHRQAAVHVCQPMMVYGRGPGANGDQAYQEQHYHHHHGMPEDAAAAAAAAAAQYERNCRTTRRQAADIQALSAKNCLTLSHQQQLNSSVMALAKKINKSIPLRLLRAILDCRLRNGWLKEEYEQLPNPLVATDPSQKMQPQETVLKLRPQLIVSRNDSMSALISGNDQYDAGLVASPPPVSSSVPAKRIICAKSPLDADSVWDFWRLIYEQEVSTIVMLTQNEDANTGELRCAQYWPTCDNEETTILSPCNEYVQKSNILPAKFKIRQETLDEETVQDGFMVRRLTLMVMATRPGENEQQDDTSAEEQKKSIEQDEQANKEEEQPVEEQDEQDEEKYVIIQRDILQLQFHCWNTATTANQLRLISFIRRANERHLLNLQQQQQQQQQRGRETGDDQQISPQKIANNPILVHCYNGLGRSGVFAALSFLLDDLAIKIRIERQQQQQQAPLQKVNLFQLVTKMRMQREMIISPYRFYELLYQLTANCVPQDVNQLV